jgi:hypothetical protein
MSVGQGGVVNRHDRGITTRRVQRRRQEVSEPKVKFGGKRRTKISTRRTKSGEMSKSTSQLHPESYSLKFENATVQVMNQWLTMYQRLCVARSESIQLLHSCQSICSHKRDKSKRQTVGPARSLSIVTPNWRECTVELSCNPRS